jgi:two-component system heavy metal sensor histidine kinase CusS
MRLTVWYTVSAFLLLAVAAGLLYRVVVETLDMEGKQDLAEEVSAVRRILKQHPLDLDALRQEVEAEFTTPSFSPISVRVLDRDGHQLAETPGMSVMLPASVFQNPPVTSVVRRAITSMRSSSGREFRGLTAVVEDDYHIQLAVDQAGNVHLLAAYRKRLALVLGAGLIVCALIGYTIAARGVRPVSEIAATIQRIRSTTLNARIESTGLPAELDALVVTFNEMLDHLQDAFGRLSQFSANIAHELRTPINNLRGEAEVALSKPRTPEEYREVLASCLEECGRLSRLIDSLLFLARAENPKTQIHRVRLDLAAELATLHDFYEASAREAGITLRRQSPEPVMADVDRTLFQRAVGNLIENALTHTPVGGTITIRAAQENGVVRVAVEDTGCGIPADQLPGLFERFHRVDEAGPKSPGGQGLGLAIVKSIITLHEGRVEISSRIGVGTCVTLELRLPSRDGR